MSDSPKPSSPSEMINSSRTFKLPKLEDDGTTNNYGEWSIKAQVHLNGWDLWKYISGPESTPPPIPPLRQAIKVRGRDPADDAVKTFEIAGNAEERDKQIADAEPWVLKNKLALSTIYTALSGSPLRRVKHLSYAKRVAGFHIIG